MTEKEERAKRFIAVEQELNQVNFQGVDIGGLLAKFNHNSFHQEYSALSLNQLIKNLISYLIKGMLVPKVKITTPSGPFLLLAKLADNPQCNALINPLKLEFQDTARLYTPNEGGEVLPYHFPRRLSILGLYDIGKFFLKNWSNIKQLYSRHNLRIDSYSLFHSLLIQLTAMSVWFRFFAVHKPKLVVVDFDRDHRNAPLVLAAKRIKVKTITLVHGVINPPYGYWPVIADEIWCWSSFQKNQLLNHDVSEEKIRIVGSPITMKYDLIQSNVEKGGKFTIGVGLNPSGDIINKKMLAHLFSQKRSNEINWLVKLHPSMSKNSWMLSMAKGNVKFYNKGELDHRSFYSRIDLLVVGNSGLGYETVANNIPIWVYRISEGCDGHDYIMIEKGGCPNITDTRSLDGEMEKLLSDSKYLEQLLTLEQRFVYSEFYESIGHDAIDNILQLIRKELQNDL